jgi:hypothetical protein
MKTIIVVAACAFACTHFASLLVADIIPCVSGNLSTVDNTTCDISSLQFTFTGLTSFDGGGSTGNTPWTDSDFIFTVLSNGFELSGPPPQKITSVAGSNDVWADYAYLNFQVTDLDGLITGLGVSGGTPSVSGPSFPSPTDNNASNGLAVRDISSDLSAEDIVFGVGVASPSAFASNGSIPPVWERPNPSSW